MRFPIRSVGAGWLMCWLGIGLAGCSANSGAPEVASAGGTITYQGKPLANAVVAFAADTGVRISHATTDANGRYRLSTLKPGDGAVVGNHRVTVVAQGPRREPPPGTPGAGMPGGPSLPGLPLIPEKYFQPHTSGLTAEVRSGEDNVFDIELAQETTHLVGGQ